MRLKTLFAEAARLDRVGCFEYSRIDGAAANNLAPPVPEEMKKERYHRFMRCQQAISRERMRERIGERMRVLINEVREKHAFGRSHADAPEIDGKVMVRGGAGLRPGEFAEVIIDGARDYNVRGHVVNAATRCRQDSFLDTGRAKRPIRSC